MRRNVGVGAVKNKQLAAARYKAKGNEISDFNFSNVLKQFETFKSFLEEFAVKHKDKIRNNAQFRSEFQAMCAAIGVDPLASSKGFWAEMLGMGDFYYHLATRVIEVTMACSAITGGVMDIDELVRRINDTRSKMEIEPIYKEDVVRAIRSVRVLGNGFSLISLNKGRQMVYSVPGELSMDQTNLLRLAQECNGRLCVSDCKEKLGWSDERSQKAVDYLITEGIAWIDEDKTVTYWVPSLYTAPHR